MGKGVKKNPDSVSWSPLAEIAPRTQQERMNPVTELAAKQRIRQKRSQKTYEALIETAFALLGTREFDDISIAELAAKAGYSVGAFYARFKSKDELFDAMVVQHLANRRKVRERQFSATDEVTLIHELLDETVRYYWERRHFWRAALIRSMRDPEFWRPIRKLSHEFADSLLARMAARAKRALTPVEEANVRFAVQLTFGTINNTILNRPGPFFMDQDKFVANLVRAFRLVSGYDELVAAPRDTAGRRRRKK
jgi:AcrR family transcriptional regulator